MTVELTTVFALKFIDTFYFNLFIYFVIDKKETINTISFSIVRDVSNLNNS